MRTADERTERGGSGVVAGLMLLTVVHLTGCDTAQLLEVEVPGRVPAESLDDAQFAEILVNSVQSDFECAWDNYVYGTAVHSDEFIASSGNLNNKQWGTRQVTSAHANFATGNCTSGGYPFYTPLQTARFQANDVYARLEAWDVADVPDKAAHQAKVLVYGAYTLVALGEAMCEVVLDPGVTVAPAEVLARSEAAFTDAIALAGDVGDNDLLNMARVGRARVRLDLGDFEGAMEDAVPVPNDYFKYATRDGSDSRRFNTHFENVMRSMHASVADHYRNVEWLGVADPRVSVTTDGENGFDAVTPFYYHDKVPSLDTPVPLASYKEAQLIVAESAARTGDFDLARRIINERHALAGIPAFDPGEAATEDEVIAHVIEERRRELFVEGGHRLNDMLRFRGTPFEIPFLGESGSIHPDGLDQTGQVYGATTCFALPDVERFGNPRSPGG